MMPSPSIIFPFEMQLEQEILDFSEGLRVIGVKPDEKLALFADNSCRWLVSDQGVLHKTAFFFQLVGGVGCGA